MPKSEDANIIKELNGFQLDMDPTVEVDQLKDLDSKLHQLFTVDKEAGSSPYPFDLNQLKSLEHQILYKNEKNQVSSALWIGFINAYISKVSLSSISKSKDIQTYLVELINKFIKTIDLKVIYSFNTLVEWFNELLQNFILLSKSNSSTDLLIVNLKELVEYETIHPQTLTFLKIITVEQLLTHGKFEDIELLYYENKIEQFKDIDCRNVTRLDVLMFYYNLVRALINGSKYEESYRLFQILFKLPVNLFSQDLMSEILAVYSINLILIGNGQNDKDTNLLKFGANLSNNYLSLFQNFQVMDFSEFLKLVYLTYYKGTLDSDSMFGLDESVFVKLIQKLRLVKLEAIIRNFSKIELQEVIKFDPVVANIDVLSAMNLTLSSTRDFLLESGYMLNGDDVVVNSQTAKQPDHKDLVYNNRQLVKANNLLSELKKSGELLIDLREFENLQRQQKQELKQQQQQQAQQQYQQLQYQLHQQQQYQQYHQEQQQH